MFCFALLLYLSSLERDDLLGYVKMFFIKFGENSATISSTTFSASFYFSPSKMPVDMVEHLILKYSQSGSVQYFLNYCFLFFWVVLFIYLFFFLLFSLMLLISPFNKIFLSNITVLSSRIFIWLFKIGSTFGLRYSAIMNIFKKKKSSWTFIIAALKTFSANSNN